MTIMWPKLTTPTVGLSGIVDAIFLLFACSTFAEWIISTALAVGCFWQVFLVVERHHHRCITLMAGLIVVLGKSMFILFLILTVRQVYWALEESTGTKVMTDWAYLLHIFLSAQSLLLVAQVAFSLCRHPKDIESAQHCLWKVVPTATSLLHQGADEPLVIVIIPCYREDPHILEKTLESVVTSGYPSSRLHIYMSFDGVSQTEEIRSIERLLGIAHFSERDVESDWHQTTEFGGCSLTVSAFKHGGKRHCQKRTFEEIKLREDEGSLARSYVLLLDSDTFVERNCIQNFVNTMRGSSSEGPRYHALSGVTRVFESGRSLLGLFQRIEYFYSQHLERQAEAACGAVHCLPGGLTMLTYTMLEAISEQYFHETLRADENYFDHMKRHFGEDRWLTALAMQQDRGCQVIGFCGNATGDTVAPATTTSFLRQRKRWYLGCLANEVSGMSDPDSWRHYPALSLMRLAYYALGTPGFPFVLTKYNVLRYTPYFWANLTLWAGAVVLTWTRLVFAAWGDDLLTAALYPLFLTIHPVQLVMTRLYAICTIRHRSWGGRNAQGVPESYPGDQNKTLGDAKRSLKAANVLSLVVQLQEYLDKSRPYCTSRAVQRLGTGSQVGDISCVLSDGIALARKRASSRKSKAGIAILQEVSILSRLSHQHVISLAKVQESDDSLEVLLWPVAPCDLMTFLSTVHKADSGISIDTELWSVLGLVGVAQHTAPLLNARGWLARSIGCLCNSIAYIHDEGVWHHDLRPQNILVTSRGPVLADFGGSVDFGGSQNSVGSPSREARNGFAADVLLLGCTLLEITSAFAGIEPQARKDINVLTNLEQSYEWNFVTNVEERIKWVGAIYQRVDPTMRGTLDMVELMLRDETASRPTAASVVERLRLLSTPNVVFGDCCVESGWT